MMKRRIPFLLVCSMAVSLFTCNGYAAKAECEAETTAALLAAYEEDEFPVQQAEANAIIAEFSQEISYVEDKYGISITDLNPETFELIKHEAILNLENEDYEFAALVDAVAIANAEEHLRTVEAASGDTAQGAGATVTVYRSFGALRGEHIVNVATGTAQAASGTVTVGLSVGEELFGVTIDAAVSASASYECSGPADYTALFNGMYATHRTAFGVLYGTIVKHEYDSAIDGTHRVLYYVSPDTKDAQSHTTLTIIGVPTYANTVRGNTVMYFPDQLSLYAMIEELPGRLLKEGE